MFCPTCQQDVPALAVPEEPGVVRCAFCSEELAMQGAGDRGQELGNRGEETEDWEQETLADVPSRNSKLEEMPEPWSPVQAPVSSLPPLPDFSDWELEPQLRVADRLLKGLRQAAPAEDVIATRAAHAQAPSWHVPASPTNLRAEQPSRQEPAVVPDKSEKSGTLAWTCLSLGVMALACGGVLIAWSLIAERPDLWSLGMPLAVVGQGGLVIGLLMQLDGLWQSSKKTDETLSQLGGKLHDLAHTTTMLGTTRSTPAQSFYVHMAEGASPHLLLADLKGQLDLLAERLARK